MDYDDRPWLDTEVLAVTDPLTADVIQDMMTDYYAFHASVTGTDTTADHFCECDQCEGD